MSFIERETCFVSTEEQRSDYWKSLRIGRITASEISKLSGRTVFHSSGSMEDMALEICGIKPKYFSPESIIHMNRGTLVEGKIRNWFNLTFQLEAKEIGAAIWKENQNYLASLDGEIDDAEFIEIKSTKKMYYKINDYLEAYKRGYRYDDSKIIFTSHLDQITACGIITGKKWCYYMVNAEDDDITFVKKVEIRKDIWDDIYEKSEYFNQKYLQPIIKEYGVRVIKI